MLVKYIQIYVERLIYLIFLSRLLKQKGHT